MKNTGKYSEEIFDEAWQRVGKRAYVFKPTDASAATGLNKRVTTIAAQPADRIVTFDGHTFYAEVKSTLDPDLFAFSLMRPKQGAAAAGVLAAGGTYDVFIHSLAHDQWYRVPYAVIKGHTAKHLKWHELRGYEWNFPT